MKRGLVAIVSLSWAAVAQAGLNDKLPPEAYVNPIDQQIAKTGVGVPGRPFPCSYEEVQDGVRVITSQPTDLCVKMLPQQHWRGLWRNDFEGSRFCPEPAKRCSFDAPGERIWLSKTPGRPQGGLYQLDFIGRKTMYRGPYGHMGVFDEEITIDRVLSMKELQAPPPPPTQAEFLSQMKKCRADGTCIPSPEEQAKIKAEAASILKAAECKAAQNCSSASKDSEAKH